MMAITMIAPMMSGQRSGTYTLARYSTPTTTTAPMTGPRYTEALPRMTMRKTMSVIAMPMLPGTMTPPKYANRTPATPPNMPARMYEVYLNSQVLYPSACMRRSLSWMPLSA